MLKEIFHNRFENFEFTRICMENPGGALGYFLGGVCAARESKLAPRSKKNSPKIDTPF